MTDREKLVGLIVEIENELIKAYPYTTDQFRIEKTADYLLANGVTVQESIRKAEDCRYYTQNSFWGAGCLGTKEIDPCKGDGCERWKPKEDA